MAPISDQGTALDSPQTSVEDIVRQLDEDRALARTHGDAAAAVVATIAKATVLGLWPVPATMPKQAETQTFPSNVHPIRRHDPGEAS
ncbi:polysaccharide deacetylase 2 family uncharacterized protein YibQ [Aminobacter lissarensis]|uniref:Polysaccharide deacetylase 2 family uncharacterized protein YibQ n=1 Tax=Aminobacter carboxidus TaxID=376165 RepID=A0A8E2BBX7_9HYPH|nr:polysaccharide deacetylase 2 family uncharacterized protein YibQ [Aminobacter lissarensis]